MIGLWQAGQHTGADVANDPNTWCWNELNTRDTAKATSFYRHVFEWDAETTDMGGMTYTEWKNAGPPSAA